MKTQTKQTPGGTVATLADSCKWFARCANAAVGTVAHPVLGAVPVCQRCGDFTGAVVTPLGAKVSA